MLRHLRHRREMSRLWAARDKTERLFKADIHAVTKEGDWKKRRELEEQEYHEIGMIDDDIAHVETTYLLREAHRLLIGRPPLNEQNAERSRFTDQWILKADALAALRSEIRKERASRAASVLSWLTALTGLIGALIGLAAVLSGVSN